jgi:hypothetical protein
MSWLALTSKETISSSVDAAFDDVRGSASADAEGSIVRMHRSVRIRRMHTRKDYKQRIIYDTNTTNNRWWTQELVGSLLPLFHSTQKNKLSFLVWPARKRNL